MQSKPFKSGRWNGRFRTVDTGKETTVENTCALEPCDTRQCGTFLPSLGFVALDLLQGVFARKYS